MGNSSSPNTPTPGSPAVTAKELFRRLASLFGNHIDLSKSESSPHLDNIALSDGDLGGILLGVQDLVSTLNPESPYFTSFHDGQVHDPLGGGSYAFQRDIVEPILRALIHDEELAQKDIEKQNGAIRTDPPETSCQIPARPILIHAGAQPNNSPHAGTLVTFCCAFGFAEKIRQRIQTAAESGSSEPPNVSVQITFIDTAPVKGQETEIGGIHYQKSYRDTPGALATHMDDYRQILNLLSAWSGVPVVISSQSEFFRDRAMPSIMRYVIENSDLLGHQLSPKYGKLALRAACPVPGCGLAEKHGRLNTYSYSSSEATIAFHCPHHGPHTIRVSESTEIARLEANAPARNLIRSMSQMLDNERHHVRVTGSDYAGMYQEMFLYRPLAGWSGSTGHAVGRTPHILYTPLIVDWSGAKLSKSIYVRDGGYEAMKIFGTEGLCSFAQLRTQFGDENEGLRRLWEEVKRWLGDPKKLFRSFSVEYLQRVIIQGQKWI